MVNSVITNILTQNSENSVKADSSSHLSGFFQEAKLITKRNFFCSVYLHLRIEPGTSSSLVSVYPYPLQRLIQNHIKHLRWIILWKKLQPWTKYLKQTLDFMWNTALRENFNFYFSAVFCLYWQNFYFVRKTGHWIMIL